eukprot:INCI13948.3.p1 GENE.INCI13948.3~~INCI13948.3.p1  ORF type:complete len:187 (-),score=43.96 INCI13948.3:481-1041(-)
MMASTSSQALGSPSRSRADLRPTPRSSAASLSPPTSTASESSTQAQSSDAHRIFSTAQQNGSETPVTSSPGPPQVVTTGAVSDPRRDLERQNDRIAASSSTEGSALPPATFEIEQPERLGRSSPERPHHAAQSFQQQQQQQQEQQQQQQQQQTGGPIQVQLKSSSPNETLVATMILAIGFFCFPVW